MDVLSEKVVKARKPHKCESCYRDIPTGSEYVYRVVVDSEIFNVKMCLLCHEVIESYPWFREEQDIDQGMFEDMVHSLAQEHGCVGDSTKEMVESLVQIARKKKQEKLDE